MLSQPFCTLMVSGILVAARCKCHQHELLLVDFCRFCTYIVSNLSILVSLHKACTQVRETASCQLSSIAVPNILTDGLDESA